MHQMPCTQRLGRNGFRVSRIYLHAGFSSLPSVLGIFLNLLSRAREAFFGFYFVRRGWFERHPNISTAAEIRSVNGEIVMTDLLQQSCKCQQTTHQCSLLDALTDSACCWQRALCMPSLLFLGFCAGLGCQTYLLMSVCCCQPSNGVFVLFCTEARLDGALHSLGLQLCPQQAGTGGSWMSLSIL